MGKILLTASVVLIVLLCAYIFFGGKKKQKKKNSEPPKEKKVEQVIKSSKPKEEKQTELEEKKSEVPKEEPNRGFKIIRKKSEIKINKKALHSGSRNPSITKVFDKNGKIEDSENEKIQQKANTSNQKNQFISLKQESEEEFVVERFGARRVDYDVINNGVEFKIGNKVGDNNRAPIITDRTNFSSHLNETDSNNPYSISGIGIKQAIDKAEKQASNVDDDAEDMVRKIKQNFLGAEDDLDPFETIRRRMEERSAPKQENQDGKFTKLDAKTLILADAVSNPKFKKNIKRD